MKLSKQLLQSMALSLAVGTITLSNSCATSKASENTESKKVEPVEESTPELEKREKPVHRYHCPACGMG